MGFHLDYFSFFKDSFLKLCVCAYIYGGNTCVYMQVPSDVEAEVSDPLELELEEVVSYPMWMLGIKLGSSSQRSCS